MKKQLPKPQHWQDFEDLCKNLWGDLLGIPLKIKKNGRSGQSQDGVDIYGIPKGETDYWGIQCKGKDSYTNAQLTEKEIDVEVERAKNFKPSLQIFVIASTANKDVKIEEYVRLLNDKHLKNNQFEILLFCWEDIADEILKRKNILDFYLNNISFNHAHDFKIVLNNLDNNEITLEPKYIRGMISDRIAKPIPHNPRSSSVILTMIGDFNLNYKKTSLACCLINIDMINEGNSALEDWKLIIFFGDNVEYVDIINSEWKKDFSYYLKSPLNIDKNKVVYCDEKTLVPKDSRSFEFWLTPYEKDYTMEIKWQLLARDFNLDGHINFIIKPEYENKDLINEVKYEYEIARTRSYSEAKVVYD